MRQQHAVRNNEQLLLQRVPVNLGVVILQQPVQQVFCEHHAGDIIEIPARREREPAVAGFADAGHGLVPAHVGGEEAHVLSRQHDVVGMKVPELGRADDHPGRQRTHGAAQLAQPGQQADLLGRCHGHDSIAAQRARDRFADGNQRPQ